MENFACQDLNTYEIFQSRTCPGKKSQVGLSTQQQKSKMAHQIGILVEKVKKFEVS